MYQGTGLYGIGLALASEGSQPYRNNEVELFVQQLCAGSKRLNAMSILWGVQNVDISFRAKELGVNHISGPVIGLPVASPKSAMKLSAQDIAAGARVLVRRNGNMSSGWG